VSFGELVAALVMAAPALTPEAALAMRADVAVWFLEQRAELMNRIERQASRRPMGGAGGQSSRIGSLDELMSFMGGSR
jgi:hypothetical protein